MSKTALKASVLISFFVHLALEARAQGAGANLVRVVVLSAPVRSGPGGGYSRIGTVQQGQVLQELGKSPEGDWYRVELWPGTTGWVFSEFVWPMKYEPDGIVSDSTVWPDTATIIDETKLGLTLSAGTLGWDGWFSLKFSASLSSRILLEFTCGQSAGRFGNITTVSLDMAVVLVPWRYVAPFVSSGAGMAYFAPHQDATVLTSGLRALVGVGGGLMTAIVDNVLIRMEARRVLLFDPDTSWSSVELAGGATIMF